MCPSVELKGKCTEKEQKCPVGLSAEVNPSGKNVAPECSQSPQAEVLGLLAACDSWSAPQNLREAFWNRGR